MPTNNVKTTGIIAVLAVAVALLVWQQVRIAQLHQEIQQAQSEASQMTVLRQKADSLSKTQAEQSELQRLRESERQLTSEVAKLRAQSSTYQALKTETAKLKSDLASHQIDDQAAGSNVFSGAMQEMVKTMVEQQVAGKMKRLKTKLNLSADQEQSIQAILIRQAELASTVAQKMFSGKMSKEDLGSAAQPAGNAEQEIKALLTPEQQTAYDQDKKEEMAGNARLAANSELLQMQTTLNLTQEQQDKIFPVLYQATMNQMDSAGAAALAAGKTLDVTEVLKQGLERKAKALEGVLTPEQLESYRKMQEQQMKLIQNFVPRPKTE